MSRGDAGSDGDDVPRIYVRSLGETASALVEYVEHGIEEEGVPWVVESGFDGDCVAIAHEAAVESPLKIGVCVSDTRLVVHHKQLAADAPVFDVTDPAAASARHLGSNAARLAKGTPLRPVE